MKNLYLLILIWIVAFTSCNRKAKVNQVYYEINLPSLRHVLELIKEENEVLIESLLERLTLLEGIDKEEHIIIKSKLTELERYIKGVFKEKSPIEYNIDNVLEKLGLYDSSYHFLKDIYELEQQAKKVILEKKEKEYITYNLKEYSSYINKLAIFDTNEINFHEELFKESNILDRLDGELSIVEIILLFTEIQINVEQSKKKVLEYFDKNLEYMLAEENRQLLYSEKTNQIKLGEDYELNIFDLSFIQPKNLRIKINGQETEIKKGLATLKIKNNTLDTQNWNAEISFEHNGMDTTIYLNNLTYEVVAK